MSDKELYFIKKRTLIKAHRGANKKRNTIKGFAYKIVYAYKTPSWLVF